MGESPRWKGKKIEHKLGGGVFKKRWSVKQSGRVKLESIFVKKGGGEHLKPNFKRE